MLRINEEFLESKAPQRFRVEALCEAAEGDAIATRLPLRLEPSRPVARGGTRDGGKESPMRRDALLAS